MSDYSTLAALKSTKSEEVWEHLPKLFGWQETDLGRGLVIELIRDADGSISRSFLECLWRNGYDVAARAAVDKFASFWVRHAIPSRSIGLHNVAAQISSNREIRLVMIDGFGSTTLLPVSVLAESWAKRRAASKVEAFHSDIAKLLESKSQGLDPGPYGFLLKRS